MTVFKIEVISCSLISNNTFLCNLLTISPFLREKPVFCGFSLCRNTSEFPKNSCPLKTYNGIQMNYKFVKHNLEGNYSVLSRVLTFNFEIGRASIDYGFHNF